ncbi:sugar transferase [Tomitella gaofuii]|uniref:sugar transferase n=1 Tax=Tomitella gaofuii TaxID=2760083 RepID=UPI0015FD1BB2|nr:sugar transferase [Tomitella gaofuii]
MTSTVARSGGLPPPTVLRADHPAGAGLAVDDAPAVAPPRDQWRRRYIRRLAVTDVAVITASVMAGQAAYSAAGAGDQWPVHTAASMCIVVVWSALLSWAQAREPSVVAVGAEEYQRVCDATLRAFGFLGVLALVLQLDSARMFLLVSLPTGLLGILLDRWLWRRWLDRQHARGRCVTRVVVLGERRAAESMAADFARDGRHAYRVVGVCIPGTGTRPTRPGESFDGTTATCDGAGNVDSEAVRMPVFGDERSIAAAIAATDADTIAVTATERLGDERLRELAWELADVGVDLVVCPGVGEIARPRLTISSAADVPLVHVGEPQYRGANRLGKMTVDRVGAAVAIVLLSPVLALCALAVGTTSRGPVFYVAERIGINGVPFAMVKFRSMVAGADTRVASLAEDDIGAGPLFKMHDDPRVTRVGRFLRRYSLDELPQLFNVLRGDMSLVGPRPPLRCEVEGYSGTVRRRLLVRPGITGLWQVSGRSDLPWDEAVRLDLSYVENWSFMGDAAIVWKTLRAVVSGAGAY